MSVIQESVRIDSRKPIERVACRAFLSADQSDITSANWVKVNLASVTYDLGVSFSSNKFTVPVSGLYHIVGQVSFTAASVQADKKYCVAIYKNTALVTQRDVQASVADSVAAQVNDELYLNKNDYIELYAYTSGTGSTVDIDGDTGGTLTFLVVRLISKEGIKQ